MIGIGKSIQSNALMPSCEPHKEAYGSTLVDHDASILKKGGTYLGTNPAVELNDDTYAWQYLIAADLGPIYNAEDTDVSLGSGLAMDGTGDYMDISTVTLGTECTISYWHKRHTDEAFPGYLEIPIGNTAESAVGGYVILVIPDPSTGSIQVRLTGATISFSFATELYDAMIGQWGHIALVRTTIGSFFTGTHFTLYINGVAVDSPQLETLADGVDMVIDRIGAGTSGAYDVEGHIDDVAFFDSAKSGPEILSIYNEGEPRDLHYEKGLVNYWRFNGDTKDYVGGNDGTLQGNATGGQGAGVYSRNLNIVCNSNNQCGKWSLSDTQDLSENLVQGQDYRILMRVKANWLDASLAIRLWVSSAIFLTADMEGSTTQSDGYEWGSAEDINEWKWMGAKFTMPAGSAHINLEAVAPYDPSHVFSFGKLYVGKKL